MAKGNPAPRTLHFHPSHPLLLIGYQDHTLRIYSIDGKHNPIATSLKLTRLRIQSALFHPTKNLVYTTGLRRRGIFVWDLNTGAVRKIAKTFNEEAMASGEWSNLRISPNGTVLGVLGATGWLCLLSAESGQYIGGCKIDGVIADYTFTNDGTKSIIISVGGEVWEFDTMSLVVTNRWRDEGGVSLTKVALTPDNNFLAIGSLSGIVTIYDMSMGSHSPVKTLYNLTTPITSLAFSPDGQMLVMASAGKRDQLRVVHIPGLKVFPNWPTSKTPLGVVECMALGDNRYLAVGRTKGVALWKVRE
jgi:U3 small nucleolar RNA-associated protein 18